MARKQKQYYEEYVGGTVDPLYGRAESNRFTDLITDVGMGMADVAQAANTLVSTPFGGNPADNSFAHGVNWLKDKFKTQYSYDRALEEEDRVRRRAIAEQNGGEWGGAKATLSSYADHPWLVAGDVVRSLPAMYAGGAIGKGIGAAGQALGRTAIKAGAEQVGSIASAIGKSTENMAHLRSAVGEGIVAGGSNAGEMFQYNLGHNRPTYEGVGPAAFSGGTTALFAWGSGRYLGGNVEARFFNKSIRPGASTSLLGGVKDTAKTAFGEGMEEVMQQAAETPLMNYGKDQPLYQGIGGDLASSAVTGAAMGAGMHPLTMDYSRGRHAIRPYEKHDLLNSSNKEEPVISTGSAIPGKPQLSDAGGTTIDSDASLGYEGGTVTGQPLAPYKVNYGSNEGMPQDNLYTGEPLQPQPGQPMYTPDQLTEDGTSTPTKALIVNNGSAIEPSVSQAEKPSTVNLGQSTQAQTEQDSSQQKRQSDWYEEGEFVPPEIAKDEAEYQEYKIRAFDENGKRRSVRDMKRDLSAKRAEVAAKKNAEVRALDDEVHAADSFRGSSLGNETGRKLSSEETKRIHRAREAGLTNKTIIAVRDAYGKALRAVGNLKYASNAFGYANKAIDETISRLGKQHSSADGKKVDPHEVALQVLKDIDEAINNSSSKNYDERDIKRVAVQAFASPESSEETLGFAADNLKKAHKAEDDAVTKRKEVLKYRKSAQGKWEKEHSGVEHQQAVRRAKLAIEEAKESSEHRRMQKGEVLTDAQANEILAAARANEDYDDVPSEYFRGYKDMPWMPSGRQSSKVFDEADKRHEERTEGITSSEEPAKQSEEPAKQSEEPAEKGEESKSEPAKEVASAEDTATDKGGKDQESTSTGDTETTPTKQPEKQPDTPPTKEEEGKSKASSSTAAPQNVHPMEDKSVSGEPAWVQKRRERFDKAAEEIEDIDELINTWMDNTPANASAPKAYADLIEHITWMDKGFIEAVEGIGVEQADVIAGPWFQFLRKASAKMLAGGVTKDTENASASMVQSISDSYEGLLRLADPEIADEVIQEKLTDHMESTARDVFSEVTGKDVSPTERQVLGNIKEESYNKRITSQEQQLAKEELNIYQMEDENQKRPSLDSDNVTKDNITDNEDDVKLDNNEELTRQKGATRTADVQAAGATTNFIAALFAHALSSDQVEDVLGFKLAGTSVDSRAKALLKALKEALAYDDCGAKDGNFAYLGLKKAYKESQGFRGIVDDVLNVTLTALMEGPKAAMELMKKTPSLKHTTYLVTKPADKMVEDENGNLVREGKPKLPPIESYAESFQKRANTINYFIEQSNGRAAPQTRYNNLVTSISGAMGAIDAANSAFSPFVGAELADTISDYLKHQSLLLSAFSLEIAKHTRKGHKPSAGTNELFVMTTLPEHTDSDGHSSSRKDRNELKAQEIERFKKNHPTIVKNGYIDAFVSAMFLSDSTSSTFESKGAQLFTNYFEQKVASNAELLKEDLKSMSTYSAPETHLYKGDLHDSIDDESTLFSGGSINSAITNGLLKSSKRAKITGLMKAVKHAISSHNNSADHVKALAEELRSGKHDPAVVGVVLDHYAETVKKLINDIKELETNSHNGEKISEEYTDQLVTSYGSKKNAVLYAYKVLARAFALVNRQDLTLGYTAENVAEKVKPTTTKGRIVANNVVYVKAAAKESIETGKVDRVEGAAINLVDFSELHKKHRLTSADLNGIFSPGFAAELIKAVNAWTSMGLKIPDAIIVDSLSDKLGNTIHATLIGAPSGATIYTPAVVEQTASRGTNAKAGIPANKPLISVVVPPVSKSLGAVQSLTEHINGKLIAHEFGHALSYEKAGGVALVYEDTVMGGAIKRYEKANGEGSFIDEMITLKSKLANSNHKQLLRMVDYPLGFYGTKLFNAELMADMLAELVMHESSREYLRKNSPRLYELFQGVLNEQKSMLGRGQRFSSSGKNVGAIISHSKYGQDLSTTRGGMGVRSREKDVSSGSGHLLDEGDTYPSGSRVQQGGGTETPSGHRGHTFDVPKTGDGGRNSDGLRGQERGGSWEVGSRGDFSIFAQRGHGVLRSEGSDKSTMGEVSSRETASSDVTSSTLDTKGVSTEGSSQEATIQHGSISEGASSRTLGGPRINSEGTRARDQGLRKSTDRSTSITLGTLVGEAAKRIEARLPASIRVKAKPILEVLRNKVFRSELGFIFTESLVTLANNYLKSAQSWYDTMLASEEYRNRLQGVATLVSNKFYDLPKQSQERVESFLSYLAEHPVWVWEEKEANITSLKDYAAGLGEKAKAEFNEVSSRYEKLTPGEKWVVTSLVRTGILFNKEHANSLIERETEAYKENMSRVKSQEEKDRLTREFEAKKKSINSTFNDSSFPYVPLRRFGDYIVSARSEEFKEQYERVQGILDELKELKGEERKEAVARLHEEQQTLREMAKHDNHYQVMFFNSELDAIKARDKINEEGGLEAESFPRVELNRSGDLPSLVKLENFLQETQGMIEDSDALRDSQDTVANLERIQQAVEQMYMRAHKDDAVARRRAKRFTIAGYDKHIVQGFLDTSKSHSNLIASIKYGRKATASLKEMQRESKNGVGDRSMKTSLFNEFLSRHRLLTAPGDKTLTGKLTNATLRATSVSLLLTSPAYYIQNALQPYMMTAPYMATIHGAKAAKMLLQVSKDLIPMVQRDTTLRSSEFHKYVTDEEFEALEKARVNGRLDIGMIQDFGHAERSSSKAVNAIVKATDFLSEQARKVEVVNRVSSFLVAYRLEKARTGDAEKAAAYADDVLYTTHGDYSKLNSPRFFYQNNFMKLATQFRKFQLIQLGMVVRMAKDAIASEDPEYRAVMRKALLYTLGMHFGTSGLLGTPIVAQLIGLTTFFLGGGGDDDDDYVRKLIGDNAVADILLGGIPRGVGLDLTKKLGAGDMMSILPFYEFRPQDGRSNFQAGLAAALGPWTSLGDKAMRSAQYFANGDPYKAVETSMPTGLSNAMKAFRYGTEGATSKGGDKLIGSDKFSAIDLFQQALGFTPKQITDYNRVKGSMFRHERAFGDMADQIHKDFNEARRSGDTKAMAKAREEWKKLQDQRYAAGFKRQSMSLLLKNASAQGKRDRTRVNGIAVDKNNRRFVENSFK